MRAGERPAATPRGRLFRKYAVPFVGLVSGVLLASGALEKNRQGELVVEGNIYRDMLAHLYIVERA